MPVAPALGTKVSDARIYDVKINQRCKALAAIKTIFAMTRYLRRS
jgi:hypothetical protein